MGCQVVSIYADEVTGMIGYPQSIYNDLNQRDYTSANLLKQTIKDHKYFVYGFTQSFAEGKIFTYVLDRKEYLVYPSGRFLVVSNCQTWSQKSLMHEDKIVAIDMKGKLCLTGTVGGRLIVWDLQFFEQKVNIKIPFPSINFSSISLSSKYIFCTDTTQPGNNVFCYDLRTTKLKAKGQLGKFQSTLKGVSWGSNFHVTIAADGVWFSRYIEGEATLEITKGMFRIFPKTSMTCVAVVDQTYIISGSVDGYIFLWAYLQCQKAIKVSDSCITEMCLHKNFLIVSDIKNQIRVFTFSIKEKKNLDQQEKNNNEITQQFVTVVIDSYQKPALQSIVVSKVDQSIYYAQTRSGILYNRMIPVVDNFNKNNYYKDLNKHFIQYQKDSTKVIDNGVLWSTMVNFPFFQISSMQIEMNTLESWKIQKRYLSNAKAYIPTDLILFALMPQLKSICYVGEGKVAVVEIASMDTNQDLKISGLEQTSIINFDANSVSILGLFYLKLKEHYIIVLFDQEYRIFKLGEGWQEERKVEYGNEVVKQIELEGQKIELQNFNRNYKVKNKQIDENQTFKTGFMHCVHYLDAVATVQGKVVSMGGQSILIKK